MTLNFTTPPQSRIGRPVKHMTAEVQEALRANPNQWALLGRFPDSVRSSIHHWVKKRENFELTVRSAGKDDDGKALFDVYVRYVGADQ